MRVVAYRSVEPRCARYIPIIPDTFEVVVDHIGVVIVAICGGVKPPDFVPLLVSAAYNLVGLLDIEVIEYVVTQGAR